LCGVLIRFLCDPRRGLRGLARFALPGGSMFNGIHGFLLVAAGQTNQNGTDRYGT
jgi:hypothetical protein